MPTRINDLFGIKYPIIQGGMVWVSGYKLALAVSEMGGLGLIGAGSMKPELLKEHISKIKNKTEKPFGVNIPLLRKDAEDLINVVLEADVKIIFTSAGSPSKYTSEFKKHGMVVVHVISNVKQAIKSQECGVDAIVAEGFEAGGHNGIDEITTFCLIPQVVDSVNIPVIAAGGISDGRGIAAALALGAEGVQIGTLFASSLESSAHINYKNSIVESKDDSTHLVLRKLSPLRALKNKITQKMKEAEFLGASREELFNLLSSKREFKGIFEGDLEEGLLEAGQSSGLVKEILSVQQIFPNLISDYNKSITILNSL